MIDTKYTPQARQGQKMHSILYLPHSDAKLRICINLSALTTTSKPYIIKSIENGLVHSSTIYIRI